MNTGGCNDNGPGGPSAAQPKRPFATLPHVNLSKVFLLRRGPARKRRHGPNLAIGPEDRPVPKPNNPSRNQALLVGCSLLVHAALIIALYRDPWLPASIDEVSISVDIVLGNDQIAALAQASSDSELANPATEPQTEAPAAEDAATVARTSPQSDEADDLVQPERELPAFEDTSAAAEIHLAQPETKPRAAEDATAAAQASPTTQEIVADPTPAKKPLASTPKSRPQAGDAPKPAAETKTAERKKLARSSSASVASVASSDANRGRSNADVNYRGLVAAHLARHKQFPAGARIGGDEGTAFVMFSLDGTGSVTSVRLIQSSGVGSLDHETQAMVRRASPFPAPPSGQPMIFTVPIRFYLSS